MAKNYAKEWRDSVKFSEIGYNDFISKFSDARGIHLSEKVDGILGALVYEKDEECYLITKHNVVIRNIPLIEEYRNILDNINVKSIVIIGDLVATRGNKILPFNDTSSIVRTADKNPEKAKMVKHYIYDVFTLNGSKVPYNKALNILEKISKLRTEYITTPRHETGGIKELEELWLKTRDDEGFDGVVARTGSKVYKIKHTYSVDLCIIGAGHKNMKSWSRNQISYLIVAFMDDNGNFRRTSNVGTGFTNKVRSELFEYVMKNKIGEDVGEIFVKPERVIEVEYREANIKNTPTYEFKNDNYKYIGDKPSITIRHPSFKRFRPDKSVNRDDLRMEQIPI